MPLSQKIEAGVAGHICLDIIPTFPSHGAALEPGKLIKMGPATISTGGTRMFHFGYPMLMQRIQAGWKTL